MPPIDSLQSERREVARPDLPSGEPGRPRRERERLRRRRVARRWRVLLALTILIAGGVIALIAVHKGSVGNSSTNGDLAGTAPLPRPSAKLNLVSPSGKAATYGLAEVIRHGNNAALAIVGRGLAPNKKHNAYAIWLYNSPSDSVRLGFVNPGVGKNGRLETAGGLPANAARFKKLLVTIETTANPTSPGTVVLEGPASGI